MIYEDWVSEIKYLTLTERLSLIEAISRPLREELYQSKAEKGKVRRVRGMLKPVGDMPTDNEITNTYTEYLIEKYK